MLYIESKRPRFSSNDDFDLTVFDEDFDFVVARSIWSHTSQDQTVANLDSLTKCLRRDGAFFTSYFPGAGTEGYRGKTWALVARHQFT